MYSFYLMRKNSVLYCPVHLKLKIKISFTHEPLCSKYFTMHYKMDIDMGLIWEAKMVVCMKKFRDFESIQLFL